LASSVGAQNTNSCPIEQRNEMLRRIDEATLALTRERRLAAGDSFKLAAAAHADAKRSLAACDAKRPLDPCDSERAMLQKAADALEVEKAAAAQRSRELVEKISDRIKAILAEYPNCAGIDR